MLYILFIVLLILCLYNLKRTDLDFMNPSFIFGFVFLFATFLCVIWKDYFDIDFHWLTTVLVGLTVLFITIIDKKLWDKKKENTVPTQTIQVIDISDLYIVLLIVFQVLSIIYFRKYLTNLTNEYISYSGAKASLYASFSSKIDLYDTLTKFWTEIFNKLDVSIPMMYRVTNPICEVAEYIVLYIAVNNIVAKKFKPIYIIPFLLMNYRIMMNGSRSPMLRALTFIFILYYILKYKNGERLQLSKKLIIRLSIVAIAFVGLMIAYVLLVRGGEGFHLKEYIFTYIGAPLVNLNNFIRNNLVPFIGSYQYNSLFGEHIFGSLYSYIDKWIGINLSSKGITKFVFSDNGIEIGNVFTCFYVAIYDFGYIGSIISVVAFCYYYSKSYIHFLYKKNINEVNLFLLIYCYLFNDLIMSFFSARFYSTAISGVFIKFIVILLFLDVFILKIDPIKRIKNLMGEGVSTSNSCVKES